MADKVTFFPPDNCITMRPYNIAESNTYHNRHMDSAPLIECIRPYQTPIDYRQKVQHNQFQQLYFLSSATTSVVKVYRKVSNTKAEEVATLADPLTAGYTDFYTDESGTTHELIVHFRNWKVDLETYPEGTYYVFVTVNYEDESTQEFISEPVWVRPTHKNTVLLRYTNRTDKNYIKYKTLNVHFQRRFSSDFMTMETASDRVSFVEQDDNIRDLYNNVYRIWKLNIGGSRGVPEYELDGIHRALACDIKSIDKKRFELHESAKIEATAIRNYPLQVATVQLREYYNDAAGAFINSQNAKVFDSGATFPYVIDDWIIQDTVTGYTIYGGYFEFIDADTEPYMNEEYYRDFYNNFTVPFHGMGGEFVINDGLEYVNGEGENFVVIKKATTLNIYAGFESTVTSISSPVALTQGGTGFHMVVWGDGAIQKFIQAGNNFAGTPIQQVNNHSYTSTGVKTIRIYTDDLMSVLAFNPQTNKITGYDTSSKVSVKLRNFVLASQDIDDDFDLSILARAKDEFRLLNLSGSNIHSIIPGYASDLHIGSYRPFRYWRYVYLNNNKFDDDAIDDFVNEYQSDTNYNSGYGVIDMSNQSPSTSPTSASLTARNALTAAFYTQIY